MEIIKTYKIKLYESNKNKHLHNSINLSSSVWNYCIAMHKRYYKIYGKHLNKYKLSVHITKLKRHNKYKKWKLLDAQSIQDIVERIDRSYSAFFNHYKKGCFGKKSPPKFKSYKKYKSFTLKQNGYKFIKDTNIIKIMGREYKYFINEDIDGIIKTVTIKRNNLQEIFLYVVVEKDIIINRSRTGYAVGADFGLKTFLTFSDENIIESPLWYTNSYQEIKDACKNLYRKKKGSNNRKRALKHLQRVHEKIYNQRRDWFYKLANDLCKKYDTICIEDLDIESMKKKWGKKVSDLSFSEFVKILEWVALKNGCEVIKVDRWYPSSKTCRHCGYVNKNLGLQNDKEKYWMCPNCEKVLNRDFNASINILTYGIAHK